MDDLVQSQPFMPPINGPVPARRLYVFGDMTLAFKADLVRLLHIKENATLQSLFDHVSFALKDEISSLPADEQQWFPRFSTIVDLVEALDGIKGAPAVRFALLCMYQLGRWILNCTETSDAYPRPDGTYILGLCTGNFAAAVVASSRTVAELLVAGTEGVRLALKTAIHSLRVQHAIEVPPAGSQISWSFLAHLSKTEAMALIEAFSADEVIDRPCYERLSEPHSFAGLARNIEAVCQCVQSVKRHDKWATERLEAIRSFQKPQNALTTHRNAIPRTAFVRRGGRHRYRWRSAWLTDCGVSAKIACLVSSHGSASHRFGNSKIAIVGFSGRFPEAPSNDAFWEILCAGHDTHRTIPPDRFDWEAHYDAAGKERNKTRVKYGCFINDPGLFDARFFNLSPREAENTDPAQRLAIMTAYEALEMAGFVADRTPSSQRDRVGVFYGTTSDDWREVNSGQDVDTYFIPGGNRAFVPGRISYFFRFSGPSISFDTACSSSFAAIHSACSFLWRGDCDTAVAGSTNVLTNPDNFVGLDRGHFLSTTGNCNPFDDAARGYCRADAVGSVVLKRLDDAIADHDPIFGVIAGANTNHCGQTVSITRPHEGDQLALFKRMLRQSNTNAEDVSYVEMHGTGTQAGDAAEMQSVLNAFVPTGRRQPRRPLHLGAVKANVGHAESASGVSALIKVLMMMPRSEIPPHVGIKIKVNRNYPHDLAERNVHIDLKATPWRRADCPGGKRISFLNNFSATGGNTALLLEDAPMPHSAEEVDGSRPLHAVALSGKSPKSLESNLAKLLESLQQNPRTSLPALWYTTTARRAHYKFRVMSVGADLPAIVDDLRSYIGRSDVKAVSAKAPKVAWVFTGQGSLYAGAGKRFFECFSHFRSDLLHYDRIARRQGFAGFLELVVLADTNAQLDAVETTTAHLALVCIQMALSRLWMSWGSRPAAVVGHSLGEYAALHAAGVLTPSDVIYLVGTRARLLTIHCIKGTHSMLAVKSSGEALEPLLGGTKCEVACINSPEATVLSGPKDDVEALGRDCHSHGLVCKVLDIPYAFHSAQVDPVITEFKSAARGVTFSAPSVPYMSPLLGEYVSKDGFLTGDYLADACRGVVNMKGVLEHARDSSLLGQDTIWLELGSHPACSNMVRDTLGPQVTSLACMRKGVDAWKTLMEAIRALYLQGVGLDWNEFHRDTPSSQQVLPLPSYQWELKNYWIQYRNNFCITKGDHVPPQVALPQPVEAPRALSSSVHRIVESHNAANVSTMLTESDVNDPRLSPVLQGHRVNDVPLCPSSLYVDMAMTIVRHMLTVTGRLNDTIGLDCGSMKVDKPFIASPHASPQLLRVSATADWLRGEVSLLFYSANAQSQKAADHATCTVLVTEQQHWIEDWKRSTYLIQSRIDSLHAAVNGGKAHKLKRGLAYKLFATLVDYSVDYQGMQEVVLDSDALEASARVQFQVEDGGFYQSPCWIDSCGHIAGFIMNGNDNIHSKGQVFINHGGTLYAGDTYILEDGVIIGVFEGVKFQGVPRRMIEMVLPKANSRPGSEPALSAPAPGRSTPKATGKPLRSPVDVVKRLPERSSVDGPRDTATGHVGSTAAASPVADILTLVAQETGIDAADLDLSSPLPDLGIDSLLTLTISGRLRDELGLEVAMTEETTMADLIASAGGQRSTTPSSTGAKTPVTSGSQGTADTDPSSIDDDETGTDVLQVVRAVIARETGVPLEDLQPQTSLDELGVDSLLALTMISALSETLGKSLPPTMFADSETIWDVENILGMNGYLEDTGLGDVMEDDHNSMDDAAGESNTARIEKAQLAILQPPHASSVCLQGNAKTAKSMLFLFPDGAGSAVSYTQLPDISPQAVVYGLNCPWMRSPENLTGPLEQYVAKFLKSHDANRMGPGQTRRDNEATDLTGLPDPVGLQNPPPRMYDFLEGLDLFGMSGKSAPKWLRPHMTAFIRMLDKYRARAFDGNAPSTRLIYARDGLCKHPDDPRPEARHDDPREML
ncbi:hypothetical protein LTR38_016553 [Friedmanniomyces endolithicus]|nr:hypothetical protein LTR38_016553 [Friedmanniomyces endolithicus]